MSKLLDITGHKYGKLTVLSFSGRRNGTSYWKCRCECGDAKDYFLGNLRGGRSKQCQKCAYIEVGKKNRIHGMANTPIHNIWTTHRRNMYKRWNQFEVFFKDVGIPPKNKPHLIRRDLGKLHSPKNSFWSEKSQGSSHRLQKFNGITMTMTYWSEQFGISRERIRQLVNKYGSLEKVVKFRARERKCSMAEVVESFPEIRNAAVYPWDEWADGQIWKLTKGKDFTCKISAFRTSIFLYAKRHNLSYTTRAIGDFLFVQFKSKE